MQQEGPRSTPEGKSGASVASCAQRRMPFKVSAVTAVAVAAAAAAAAAACLETLPEVVDLHPEEDREHRITPVQRELKRVSSRPAWGLLVRGSSLAWHT